MVSGSVNRCAHRFSVKKAWHSNEAFDQGSPEL